MSFIMNYHDATVYDDDIRLFEKAHGWLNDRCVQLGCKLLEFSSPRYEFDVIASTHPSNKWLEGQNEDCPYKIIDPTVLMFLKLQCETEDEFRDAAVGLGIRPSDNLVLLPINDCDNNDAISNRGSHWSMLVLLLDQGAGYHFDSLSQRSGRDAWKASKQSKQARLTAQAFARALVHRSREDPSKGAAAAGGQHSSAAYPPKAHYQSHADRRRRSYTSQSTIGDPATVRRITEDEQRILQKHAENEYFADIEWEQGRQAALREAEKLEREQRRRVRSWERKVQANLDKHQRVTEQQGKFRVWLRKGETHGDWDGDEEEDEVGEDADRDDDSISGDEYERGESRSRSRESMFRLHDGVGNDTGEGRHSNRSDHVGKELALTSTSSMSGLTEATNANGLDAKSTARSGGTTARSVSASDSNEAGEASAAAKLEQQLQRLKAEKEQLMNPEDEAAAIAALPQLYRNQAAPRPASLDERPSVPLFNIIDVPGAPQQEDAYSCGVYALLFAQAVLQYMAWVDRRRSAAHKRAHREIRSGGTLDLAHPDGACMKHIRAVVTMEKVAAVRKHIAEQLKEEVRKSAGNAGRK